MTARFHCALRLAPDCSLDLPPGAARHVQVRRLQPGDAVILFDGFGGEYDAAIERMGRSDVAVKVGRHRPVEREAARPVHLAVGMPANERMDWLVEKATELGVASIQPLVTAHGVLRLANERADKKRSHWEAIAIAACEQCGRNRIPVIHPVMSFAAWIDATAGNDAIGGSESAAAESAEAEGAEAQSDRSAGVDRYLLSLTPGALPLAELASGASGRSASPAWVLNGPEGGLSASEEQQAIDKGFRPSTLGSRVLRAETAALAALMLLVSTFELGAPNLERGPE
ncbi:Ribosomal RNA small subunit methyltransferase E [Burkholderiales bacterium 8X]|nr:Ribosomal RNA small subunit methyltransferase E [Burkholderiales bacterium 8X]